MNEVRNEFEEQIYSAVAALGSLMVANEVCTNQRAVMKINRFRAWLLELGNFDKSEVDNKENVVEGVTWE